MNPEDKQLEMMRAAAQPKHEWASGGTRNPYGSNKKFNASRSRMIWLSKYTWLNEEGKEVSESQTRNLGRNMLKRVARDLSKKHGLSYSQSKRLLMEHMKNQEESQDG